MNVSRVYRHTSRYRKIVSVFVKHGFGDFVARTNLEKYINLGRKIFPGKGGKKPEFLSRAERFRMVLEELGPTFVKFGQIMSGRPDLLPNEFIVELEKLQSSVPPFSRREAERLIEKELGKPVAELFREFVSEPIASASIAQIHKATLISGEEVAVKVQRPGIKRIIDVDIEIMFHIASLMEKYLAGMDIINPVAIVKEFEKAIKNEMDFTIEASNIERFGRIFSEDDSIYVPKVYREYSTQKILTMEFIDGIKVSDIDAVRKAGYDTKIVAEKGANLVLKQIFEYGYFHSDPHPGNIMVLDDHVICFLDFGQMGVLPVKYREYLGDIIIGVTKKNAKQITKTLLRLADNEQRINTDELEVRVDALVERYAYLPLKEINMGQLLREIFNFILSYKLKMPSCIYLLLKALITIESVGRKLDPDFNMIKHTEPFAKKLLKERLSFRRFAKDVYSSASELGLLLRDFPAEIREIIKQIKLGKMKIEFEHKGLEPMLNKHDQISNRISFSIVLSSLVIGSSLIILSDIPPRWYGISIIGIIGFLGAGIMGFWLLISILKHGKI